ncbi:MAG: hypothetical protein KKC77_19600 [Proteobacteria bacterium]|nr:hypothetical protein [Pseudomonadota bacterium]
MTTKLILYNTALLYCHERSISSLAEDREPRRLLDRVWDANEVRRCLEMGQWHFAMRGSKIDPDPSIVPNFGYINAYNKPSDWVITAAVCQDEYFTTPLNRYTDEAGQWYADIDPLYVRYVSDDNSYGNDLGAWPETFADFVAWDMASRIIGKLAGSKEDMVEITNGRKQALQLAKNKAAMADPTRFAAQGNWSKARTYGSKRGDGGNSSGNLIG